MGFATKRIERKYEINEERERMSSRVMDSTFTSHPKTLGNHSFVGAKL